MYGKVRGKAMALHAKRPKGNGLWSRGASLVKEQRARIYILRRCVTMLLCWYGQKQELRKNNERSYLLFHPTRKI